MIKIGDQLICPVCGKEFKATDDTMYIVKGGYTCSWKCFLVRAREFESTKNNRQTRTTK